MQGNQRLIGEAALSMARAQFKNTATDVKRLIGLKFKQPEVQRELEALPFKCAELPNGDVGVVLNYDNGEKTFSCEQLVAMMLGKLQKVSAAANLGVEGSDVVVSVPGYFTDRQRQAVLSAAKIAGFQCLRLLNEHAAIALSYGIYKSARNLFHETEPQHCMFIDMGHSSYTVSVVAFVQGQLKVKSVAYDRCLGGRDFDLALAKHAASEFEAKYKVNPLENPKSRIKLLAAAEKAKKNLSPHGVSSTNLNVECLVEEYDYNGRIELATFEEAIAGLLGRLEGPVLKALENAGVEKSQLSSVEIVGGATRVASVKRKLSEILALDATKNNFGLSTTLNADESVARGCALQCAILSPLFKVKEFQIADVLSYPVQVSWDPTSDSTSMDTTDDGDEEAVDASNADSMVIFTPKDDFPKTKRITLRRKSAFEVRAAYDEAATALLPEGMDRELGRYSISGFPEIEGDEVPRVRVNVRQDIHGMFNVSSCQMMQEIPEVAEAEETKVEEAKAEKTEKSETKDTEKSDESSAPKKKRFRRVELKVEASTLGLDSKTVSEYNELEVSMAQQDRIIEETANKRNELESYIYDMRNQLGDKLRQFVGDEERSKLEKMLVESEDWLYTDEGFDSVKSVYVAKLKELTDSGSSIDQRYRESVSRPVAAAELTDLVENYKKLANSTEEAQSHWTDEERETIRESCTKAESWLFDALAKQGDLKNSENPVLTTKSINEKSAEIRSECRPIVTKPKPVVKPEPVAEDTEKNTETTEEGKENADMDLD